MTTKNSYISITNQLNVMVIQMKKLIFTVIILMTYSVFAEYSSQDSTNTYEFYYNETKYEIVLMRLTWEDAAEYAFERGAMLAEIDSQEEQDTIFKALEGLNIPPHETRAPDGGNASYVWIGGNDLNEEGKWIWDGAGDGIGFQFWEGTTSGSSIDFRYNNWGNEPDNFGNQDALGLAITRWPLGVEGQWNDIYHTNELYFVIEYNLASIKIKSANYSYDQQSLNIIPEITTNFDSIYIMVDEDIIEKKYNLSMEDTLITSLFTLEVSKEIRLRLFGFNEGNTANSKEYNILILSFSDPIDFYSTDFEENPANEFLSVGQGFAVDDPFPFRNFGIHSLHDYPDSSNLTIMLRKPIVINEFNSILSYSEVVVVEPGDSGSIFGDENFKDYVIVEGSKTINEWIPLIDGYDSRLHPEWENAWHSGGLLKNLFKRNAIDLKNTFESGDTILIRFRLYSDDTNNGWGWVIDSLEIQDFPLNVNDNHLQYDYKLGQNYPNPFNPSTTIQFEIPSEQIVTISIFDVLGRKVSNIVNDRFNAGNHRIEFQSGELSSGIYFYRLETPNYYDTKRMILLK